jgi:hypothetical protein
MKKCSLASDERAAFAWFASGQFSRLKRSKEDAPFFKERKGFQSSLFL